MLNTEKCKQLIEFSQMIEILCDKYRDSYDKEISEQIESRDPNIFVWIPSIILLKSLFKEDSNICINIFPTLFDSKSESGKLYYHLQNSLKEFEGSCRDTYELYNNLEKLILLEEYENEVDKVKAVIKSTNIDDFLRNIKNLAMQMQRINPLEWNNFIDLAMN